jgi:hypothetical protein
MTLALTPFANAQSLRRKGNAISRSFSCLSPFNFTFLSLEQYNSSEKERILANRTMVKRLEESRQQIDEGKV